MLRACCFLLVLFSSSLSMASLDFFGKIAPGVYRGGNPELDEVRQLKDLGIKTIINLQGDPLLYPFIISERPSFIRQRALEVRALGLNYIHVPLVASRPFDYEEQNQLLRLASYLANKKYHPLYIHCRRGSDRTGLVVALYRVIYENWTADQAFEEMDQYGHHSVAKIFMPHLREFLEHIALHARGVGMRSVSN